MIKYRFNHIVLFDDFYFSYFDWSINQSTLDLQFHYTKFDEAVERSQQDNLFFI